MNVGVNANVFMKMFFPRKEKEDLPSEHIRWD